MQTRRVSIFILLNKIWQMLENLNRWYFTLVIIIIINSFKLIRAHVTISLFAFDANNMWFSPNMYVYNSSKFCIKLLCKSLMVYLFIGIYLFKRLSNRVWSSQKHIRIKRILARYLLLLLLLVVYEKAKNCKPQKMY